MLLRPPPLNTALFVGLKIVLCQWGDFDRIQPYGYLLLRCLCVGIFNRNVVDGFSDATPQVRAPSVYVTLLDFALFAFSDHAIYSFLRECCDINFCGVVGNIDPNQVILVV